MDEIHWSVGKDTWGFVLNHIFVGQIPYPLLMQTIALSLYKWRGYHPDSLVLTPHTILQGDDYE